MITHAEHVAIMNLVSAMNALPSTISVETNESDQKVTFFKDGEEVMVVPFDNLCFFGGF